MALYRYRGATAAGAQRSGLLEGESEQAVLGELRRLGVSPIAVTAVPDATRKAGARTGAASRQAVTNALSELAVLLGAGLTLDRALTICTDNIVRAPEKAAFAALHAEVKEGAPLSRAMAEQKGMFPAIAPAMAEAGEASGRLDRALARLAETLQWSDGLRRTIGSAMVYPAILMVIAVSVILMMLLWVVPQFESLFSDAGARLPPMTELVMSLSRGLRQDGLWLFGLCAVLLFLLSRWLMQPAMRQARDGWVLALPQVGALVTAFELARFTRVLSSLIEAGVPLSEALDVARRTMGSQPLAEAVGRTAVKVKQGAGLTASLSEERLFPRSALGFIRTGEETAQLDLMLGRLSDVLDQQVRTRVETLIAVLTPLITVLMGAVVATVIASIMTAILGFNDLALAP